MLPRPSMSFPETRPDPPRAPEGLEAQDTLFSLAFRMLPEAATITRRSDGAVLDVNQAFLELSGFARQQVIGPTTQQLGLWAHPEDRSRMLAALEAKGELRDHPTRIQRADGTVRRVLLGVRAVTVGNEPCLLTVARDTTEIHETQAKLDRERETLGRILALNPYAIQILDSEGRHRSGNAAFLELFGEEPPRSWSLFEDPVLARNGVLDRLEPLRRGRSIALPALWYDLQEVLKGQPSRLRCLRATAFPLLESDGSLGSIVLMHEDITEWRQAEEALRKSEAHARNLFLTMAQGVVYQDAQGQVVAANPAAERILGLGLEDLRERTSEDERWRCVREDGSPFPGLEHPAMVALREARPVEGVIMGIPRPPKGEVCWVSVSAQPLFEQGPEQPSGVFATLTDITNLKRAQDELRNTAQQLRGVLEGSPAVIFQLAPDGTFLLSEGRGLADLGLKPGQVVGLNALDVYQDDPEVVARLKEALDGIPGHAILSVSERLFDTILTPVMDGGRLSSVIGVATDVTQRARAEQALSASEGRFQVLVDHTTDNFFWVEQLEDGHFLIQGVNAAQARIFGLPVEAMTNQRLAAFLPRSQAEHFEANYTRCLEHGHPMTYREEVDLPQGHRVMETLLVPLQDADGAFRRLVGTSRDITEAVQAEESQRQAQKLESLGVLAGGIAHDFNNLLAAILGNLNLAQSQLMEGSPLQGYLERAERTVLRASELTKQLLAYSGKAPLEVKSQDLNDLVREMGNLLSVSLSKRVTLDFDLQEGLPALEADGAQLQQVVMNLVTNAGEAIGDREGRIQVATRCQDLTPEDLKGTIPGCPLHAGPHLVLEVRDDGSGMPPEVMARIFDPFYSTKGSGRGLGLSAMLGILRKHRAGMRLRSRPGEGTTFTLFFPASSRALPSSPAPAPRPPRTFSGCVLVADDEPLVLEFACGALEMLGFQTVASADGEEALARFQASPEAFRWALLDLTMPRRDGRETLKALQALRPGFPVVLCSGYSAQGNLERLDTGQGPVRFLPKPYQLADLRNLLADLLDEGIPKNLPSR